MAKKKKKKTKIKIKRWLKKSRRRLRLRKKQQKRLIRVGLASGAIAIAAVLGWQMQTQHSLASTDTTNYYNSTKQELLSEVDTLDHDTESLEGKISDQEVIALQAQLKQIKDALNKNDFHVVEIMIDDYLSALSASQAEAANPVAKAVVATSSAGLNSGQIPILMYHHTPANFESQLQALIQKGYTTVTMSQVSASLRGHASLPSKPVVITFDDGYADQLKAFDMLKAHNMRATFYLILGRNQSGFCLGILQDHHAGCADTYLNWDQVKMLDRSGLIEIGAHTIDHVALAGESEESQWHEINDVKVALQTTLGHPITTFAYPYGSFNNTTLQLVQKAGYSSAVSTTPGIDQSLGTIYKLERIRDANLLP